MEKAPSEKSMIKKELREKEDTKYNNMKVACLKREVVVANDHAPSSGDYDAEDDNAAEGKVRGEFELSLQASGEEAQNLERFFAGVDSLKDALRRVKATTRRLGDVHDQAFDPTTPPDAAHDLREMFARLVTKNEALLEGVRAKTMELKGVELTSDAFRKLKHNILNGTNMKSAKLLLDYKGILKDHNLRLREETFRQLKEQPLDEKGDSLADDDPQGDSSSSSTFDPSTEQVGDFMQKFVFREKASSAKKYLEEKQRDLENIERNMMELNELMKDFAVMVESANEPLDQIDTYLRSTKANMVMVEENLRQAKYKVLGMRKKKLFTALGVAVVVIVVVAVVVGIVCLL